MTYTREEIKKMPVGRQLDALAQEIIGDLSWSGLKFDRPSTEVSDGIYLLDHMKDTHHVSITSGELENKQWRVQFWKHNEDYTYENFARYTSNNICEAITKAAILSVMDQLGGQGDE